MSNIEPKSIDCHEYCFFNIDGIKLSVKSVKCLIENKWINDTVNIKKFLSK